MSDNNGRVEKYVFVVKPEDGQNFWDANKELEYLEPYASFKKKEGKRRSGRIMEAIWMCFDPKARAKQSGKRTEEDIKKDIAVNFLKDKNFPWSDYITVTTAYKQDCKSKLEKELDYWEMELAARSVYQRSLPWDTQRKEKDEMLKSQKPLYDAYLEIVEKMDKERSEKRYHAGTQKSLLEKR